jgi:hypothetical protein
VGVAKGEASQIIPLLESPGGDGGRALDAPRPPGGEGRKYNLAAKKQIALYLSAIFENSRAFALKKRKHGVFTEEKRKIMSIGRD